jgi:hypothetical protein
MVSEEKNFKNQSIRNKNRLWRPCLLTNRDEMSNLYRGPSIYASYQVSVHLAKRFQRRRLLEIDQSEISFAYGGHVFSSETVLPNEPKLGRSAMKISHFIPIR